MPYPLEGMVCLVTRTHTYTGRKAYLVSCSCWVCEVTIPWIKPCTYSLPSHIKHFTSNIILPHSDNSVQ